MSFEDAEAAAVRTAALQHLHQYRHQPNTLYPPHAQHPPPNTTTNGYYSQAPPPQSRDATMTSRFFNPTPSYGNVLVPNSSPLGHDANTYQQSQPSYHSNTPTMPQWNGQGYQGGWSNSGSSYGSNAYSTSSGFLPQSHALNASPTRPLPVQVPATPSGDGATGPGPSRKRTYSSADHDPANLFASPTSPEIQRPGQRRRTTETSAHSPSSSEDDLPSTIATAPVKRIVRGRPMDSFPPTASQSEDAEEVRFNRFKITMPTEPLDRIRAAWEESAHDVPAATALLQDLSWSPRGPKVGSSPKVSKAETGRVKELDDARQAQRQAEKAKGKKSAIYNRINVESSKPASTPTPPPVKRVSPPPSPDIALPKRKRARKVVVDSEDSEAYEDSDNDSGRGSRQLSPDENLEEIRALSYFNGASAEALQELTGCTADQAKKIVELRPFDTVADLNVKLGQGKKKSGPGGISSRIFSDCTAIFAGYGTVDTVLENCEKIGAQLRKTIASWTALTGGDKGKSKEATPMMGLTEGEVDDGALSLTALVPATSSKDCLLVQPALLSDVIKLKDYQLTGVSWLRLLYRKALSCILADEMGLGKTAQVISFFASLKEQGNKGPHLVVVPSSTLENWVREFNKFAPGIVVQTYYAGKEERPLLRATLQDTMRTKNKDGWEVLITTYNLAQGDDKDRKFFKKIEWDCCVFDEGHVLKNFQSQRYQALLKYESRWRLLLTGTPLQNNLQELVSLMNFILPEHFAEHLDSMRAIFKTKGDSKVSMLSQERVSRAKKMMTPFVLRRRKDQVLKDLPMKYEKIEWCEMTGLQKSLYKDAIQRSRKTVLETETPTDELLDEPPAKPAAKKKKITAKAKEKFSENSSNVLMDLRKAALHPMLFRSRFTDDMLSSVARLLLKEPDFKKRKAVFEYVLEDMQVMTDAELQLFVATYKSTRKYLQEEEIYLQAGKVTTLLRLLGKYKEEGRRVLVFSQFTQVLDILQPILRMKDIKYLLLTGATAVDVRQSLVDEFTEDESISVFLLSTKAGGMGINLTAASVVIMFDQDFNPHNDRQAQDRAYRIGQKRDVDVIKLITKGTIEEDMLRLGMTKLALDEAVAGDVDEESAKGESTAEKQMKASLMSMLRKQFEEDGGAKTPLAEGDP